MKEINNLLKLHPSNYLTLKEPIIFFLGKDFSEDDFKKLLSDFHRSRMLVVTAYRLQDQTWRYNLFAGKQILSMIEGLDNVTYEKHYNFQVFKHKHREIAQRNLNYGHKQFTIIPQDGIRFVFRQVLYASTGEELSDQWNMTESGYDNLIDRMERYFSTEDDEEEQTPRFKIKKRFEWNVLKPFREYTDKENWAEEYQQSKGACLTYFRREPSAVTEKGMVYEFYSNDPNADPEKSFFNVGDRISVVSDEGRSICKGLLGSIDDTAQDAVVYAISFFTQFHDADLPASGRLVMAVNDTQTRVRGQVIRKIEKNLIESKYMYRTFSDFSTAGYDDPADDLADYLAEKIKDKRPPNQMQLEAIIKGILTKDLLLVLGPPGTGKTTVISQWVEYFIRNGKRVLISSQNNAAVDNVLARFKGKGEIVRLGNEDKVQENCKEFLPHHKLGTIAREFQTNRDRVDTALSRDKESISAYRQRLLTYYDLVANYADLHAQIKQMMRSVALAMNTVRLTRAKAAQSLEQVESTIELRAHKQLFLEEAGKKNFFVRMLNAILVRQVKNELKETDEILQQQRDAYRTAVRNYNAAVEAIRNEIDQLRRTDTLAQMNAAKEAVMQYTRDIILTGQFYLNLESELTSCYRRPMLHPDPLKNPDIITAELQKIASLELTIAKTEAALGDWYDAVTDDRNDIFQNVLLDSCQIVGATCIGINSNRDFANVKFDVSIVDESGQIQIHNALIPMSRAPKNLLLGDYMQIPPCANDVVVDACRQDGIDTDLLNKSFFEFLFQNMRSKLESDGYTTERLLSPVLSDYEPTAGQEIPAHRVREMIQAVIADEKKLVNLNRQFRMPGHISDVISEWFYESNYFSSYNMANFMPMIPGTTKPMVVISTHDHRNRGEAQPESKMGFYNDYEADLVAFLVQQAIDHQPEEKRQTFCRKIEDHIGIISAYGAQVRTIRDRLKKKLPQLEAHQIHSMVASLDSFQGQERPLIIYSLTRSTQDVSRYKGRVGFMKELRRLNVAFTRCQQQLVILGDIEYLCRCMNTEFRKDGNDQRILWSCELDGIDEDNQEIGQAQIVQCAACEASCERKFARFMRLLMQHVRAGSGDYIRSEQLPGQKM